MIAVIADDEPIVMRMTEKSVRKALPDAEVYTFLNGNGLVEFAEKNTVQIAFLDIRMSGITGLELAEKLHTVQPRMNLIFTTAYEEYKSEAMDLHASGYLMKPVTKDSVLQEMEYLRFPIEEEKPEGSGKRLEVTCFGDFKASSGGVPLVFSYSKTYELLAFLIDRRGAMCSYPLIIEALWDGESGHLAYMKRIRSDLINVFTDNGIADVIYSKRGFIGLDTKLINCDYYDFLEGKPDAVAAYQGIYMSQFPWAEETNGTLYFQKLELKGVDGG